MTGGSLARDERLPGENLPGESLHDPVSARISARSGAPATSRILGCASSSTNHSRPARTRRPGMAGTRPGSGARGSLRGPPRRRRTDRLAQA